LAGDFFDSLSSYFKGDYLNEGHGNSVEIKRKEGERYKFRIKSDIRRVTCQIMFKLKV